MLKKKMFTLNLNGIYYVIEIRGKTKTALTEIYWEKIRPNERHSKLLSSSTKSIAGF